MKTTATNTTTGEERRVEVDLDDLLEAALGGGEMQCSGPCRCEVEPDGTCPEGWPSVGLALGVV